MSKHLVFGAGPIGSATALELAQSGQDVTVASRSGRGPQHDKITLVSVDASNAQAVSELASGSAAIYNCLNPAYTKWATDWPPVANALLAAAELGQVERALEQRTAMLAGVSHDLRTILTRFKLELAVLGDGPKVQPLKEDVDEMQRMLEAYMAFVKGDAGETPQLVELLRRLTEHAAVGIGRAGNRAGLRGRLRTRPRTPRRRGDS